MAGGGVEFVEGAGAMTAVAAEPGAEAGPLADGDALDGAPEV